MMNNRGETKPEADLVELDRALALAIQKIRGKKASELCRYLPSEKGLGHMHHFSIEKLRKENPYRLLQMVQKYIVQTEEPTKIAPKQRAARGSRKRHNQFIFSEQEVERIRQYAKIAGDEDMARRLRPQTDPATMKRELISSIRQNRVEPDLWNAYVDWVTAAIQHQARNKLAVEV